MARLKLYYHSWGRICFLSLIANSTATRTSHQGCVAFAKLQTITSPLKGFHQEMRDSTTILSEHSRSRRDALLASASNSVGLVVATGLLSPLRSRAVCGEEIEQSKTISVKPLADLPMTRLRLPKGALGREYVSIPLNVDNQGPFEFLVDSGLTTEMITPHLQDVLRIKIGNSMIRGIGAGGSKENPIVELKDYSLCCGKEEGAELPLPPLHAIITDFPQEHIDPTHDVEGMIGMEFLEMFDVDFDFPNGRIRFWPPKKGDKRGLVSIPAAVLNESGLEGIRIRSPKQNIDQPMLGIIDSGASFSTVNLAAADLLGLPRDPKKYKLPFVQGIGIDGRPLLMPTASVQFTFAGNAVKDPSSAVISFEKPPEM